MHTGDGCGCRRHRLFGVHVDANIAALGLLCHMPLSAGAATATPLQAFLDRYLARREHERRGWWAHLLECHQQGRADGIRSFVEAALLDGVAEAAVADPHT